MGLAFLLTQLFVCPVYAQDWFLPRTEQLLPVRHGDPEECASLLQTMVPDASIQVVGSGLRVKGSLDALADVRLLLHELDRPVDSVMLEIRLLVWDKSCATEIRTVGGWSGDLLSVTQIWPPCSGGSLSQLNFLQAQGRLRPLAGKWVETRLGKSLELELTAPELELILGVEVSLGAKNGIETKVRIGVKADGSSEHRISRLLSDGFPVVVKGFADQQLPKLEESEEIVLVLVPHLTR